MKKRVAILISGRGSNMAALIDAAKDRPTRPKSCWCSPTSPDAAGLARAREAGIATAVIEHKPFGKDRAAFDRAVHDGAGAAPHRARLPCRLPAAC